MPADALPATSDAAKPPQRARGGRLGAWVLSAVVGLYFIAGLGFLSVRYLVLPNAGAWRMQIAEAASDSVGAPVRIGALHADWDGFRPRLHLRQVDVLDGAGSVALSLDRVDATLAWSSLIRLQPFFDRLELFQPSLQVVRAADGAVSIGGFSAASGGGGGGLDWLLQQRQIVIRDARLSWNDTLRGAPALVLGAVNLRMDRVFGGHRLGLTARSDDGIFATIDVRARLDFGPAGDLAMMTGRTFARVDDASIEALSPWIDMPLALRGQGDAALWLDWKAGAPVSLQTEFDIADGGIQFDPQRPALALAAATGEVSLERMSDGFAIETKRLALRTAEGVVMAPSDVALTWTSQDDRQSAHLKANLLDLAVLSALGESLPMTDDQASSLAATGPRGRFTDLDASWSVEQGRTVAWSLATRFDALAVNASAHWPGATGISGHVSGNQQAGRYTLDSDGAALTLPGVFLQPLNFSHLIAEGSWAQEDNGLRVTLDRAGFANADTQGDASGHYVFQSGGPGEIDLQARLGETDGTAVWRYLPVKINDNTRDWLQRGIVRGTAHDARLRLKGPLSRFPFRAPGEGIFLITAQVTGALLDVAPGWPQISQITGALRFDGPRMTITASEGLISGVKLSEVVADVPDLDNGNEVITITGKADGLTRDFLAFIEASPVSERINGFTAPIEAEGRGHLDLRLDMPLRHVVDTAVDGRFSFKGNRLRLLDGLPWMENAAGRVGFTGASLTIDEATATVLGGPVRVSANTGADGLVMFSAAGQAKADAIAAAYPHAALAYLSGAADWQLSAQIGKGESMLEVRSSLEGLGASLPAPLNKSAQEALPSSVTIRFVPDAPVELEGRLGERASARLTIPRGDAAGISGGIGVGAPARPATGGVLVAWQQKEIDLDRWRELLGDDSSASPAFPIAGVTLSAESVRLRNRLIHDVKLRAERNDGNWTAEVRSREAEGTLSWLPEAEGRLVARLSRLSLGKAASDSEPAPAGKPAASFPALDVEADTFGINGLDLGHLKVSAFNRAGTWHLNALSLDTGTSRLTGSGLWAPGGSGRTELDFELKTADVGKLLTRLDYPDAVQRGTATLNGKLSWQGSPAELDYPSMNGAFELLAESGQFNKLDPGMGRLLGVLSLQALPRRITLDFRDVFSEGFAFDRISGSIGMTSGVLSTDAMQIRGPAANILMSGQASVPAETQDLRVKVQPTLSESVAVGAALGGAVINPVAGVVTYIVQKALEDPVEKLFAFEYEVTGTWADPVVEKVDRKSPDANGESRPGSAGPRN